MREVRKPTRLLLLRQLPTIGDAHRDPALELYTANRSMTTNKPIIKPNLAAAIAFAILMAFAVGKVLALASGSPALDRLHPLLPGTYRSVTNFAFPIELVSIFIWCLWGTKRFLQICGGLAVTYLSYHITSEVFGSRDSCSCLGQFTFWSEWVRRNERLLSISGSVALLSLSVFGLTPNACKVANNEIYTGVTKLSLNTANAVLLWLFCAGSAAYIGRNVVLGGDEGMEMAKALFAFRKPNMVSEMWNDQPFLFTALVNSIWKMVGVSLISARVIVVIIGAFIPLLFGLALRQSGLGIASLFATGLIFCHPELPTLTSAAMLEMPAYAVGLSATIPLLLGGRGISNVFASAIIAALSLHLKLTASFALVVAISYLLHEKNFRRCGVWIITVALLFWLGVYLSTGTHTEDIIKSHFTRLNSDAKMQAEQNAFDSGKVLLGNPISFLLAGFCVIRRFLIGDHRVIIPWLVALIVGIGIHSVHIPWWWYYTIHIVIPLSFLAGVGACDLINILKERILNKNSNVLVVVLSVFGAAASTFLCFRTYLAYKNITALTPLENNATQILRKYSAVTKWGFTRDPMNGFVANIVAPPELVVLPMKRFWSGQITREKILKIWKHYKPEQIVIDNGENTKIAEWATFSTNYTLVFVEGKTEIYIRNNLNPRAFDDSSSKAVLKRMGL